MKTYNLRLILNQPEKDHWVALLKKQAEIYNYISTIKYCEQIPQSLKLIHDRVYHACRKSFLDVPSQIIIKTEQEVKAAYATAKSNKHVLKGPITKKKLSLRLDKRLYSKLTPHSIFLTSNTKRKRTCADFVLYDKVSELFSKYKALDPLVFCRDSELYLSVTFDITELPVLSEDALGVDLGMHRLAVTSDGVVYSSKEYLKNKRKIRYLKKQLQKKNTKSSKRHLKKIRRKEHNVSKNSIHHLANDILKTDKSIIVLEDLTKIKYQTSKTDKGFKRTKHNRRMGQIPFYMIKQILSYKAPHLGKRVETVNPKDTSKLDCRGLENGVRKGCRYYGIDGVVLDADWNAAINIAKRYSKHPISFKVPLDGTLNLVGRLLSTSQA